MRVNGAPLGTETREVWAVNKPAGVVSTAREPGERRAVVELVDSKARLYPVGRPTPTMQRATSSTGSRAHSARSTRLRCWSSS